ncbi:MAG: NUDIX domain-containing protein, partial [Gammaproteobacteria bacterium]|nr:NUDIX domain-containing protein [Gammaproteobacteria bacterium]
LCRYHGIDTWPGETATARTLWALAERHTPAARVDEYTQAIMDLGATVCRRRHPRCDRCPLAADCRARIEDRIEHIPAPKPRRARPLRATRFLVLRRRDGAVLLTKRPPAGVWGGLWSFPECAQKEDPADSCRRRFGVRSAKLRYLARRRHGFTHFELDIEPVLLDINGASNAGESSVMDAPPVLWYKGAATERVGIAAPVQTILEEISQSRPATMS